MHLYLYTFIPVYTLRFNRKLRLKADMKHNHIKAVAKIVISDAGTKKLTRAFAELTTRKIEVKQMCFSRLRLAPRPEIG